MAERHVRVSVPPGETACPPDAEDEEILRQEFPMLRTLSDTKPLTHLSSRLPPKYMSTPAASVDHRSLLTPREALRSLISVQLCQGFFLEGDPCSEADDGLPPPAAAARPQLLSRCAVCAVLVLVNANDTLLKAVSQQRGKALLGERYSPSSVMLVSNLISVLIGNVLSVVRGGSALHEGYHCLESLGAFWDRRQILQMSVPAVLFTLSGTLKFVALGLVPPDVVVNLEQCTVLLCALMGWAWLGKRYSLEQVAMLLLVSGGFLWYQRAERQSIGESQDASGPLAHYWTGISLMCCSVVLVTAGGLSCEKLLKRAANRPFYVQKAQMEFSMAVAGTFYCIVVLPLLQGTSPLLGRGLFHGWDGWTVMVVVLHTGKSWLATTTVRMLDNLTFTLAGNVAMLLVYVERLLLLPDSAWGSFRLEVFAALCCTALGVGGFAAASRRRQATQREVEIANHAKRRSRKRALRNSLRLEVQKRLVPVNRPRVDYSSEPLSP